MRLLLRLFLKNNNDISNPDVRRKYGIISGFLGISLNILLFAGKLLVGIISSSIAATADAFNNLSDAGSSVVSLIGFKLSGKKPDPEHPFGHGRLEYISGMIISMLIIVMGFELALSSFDSIINPKDPEFNLLSTIILGISILVKLYMAFYNRKYGNIIESPTMLATAADSLSDTLATSLVLISMIISRISGLYIDGFAGLLVAIFILISGIKAGKETIEPLLGVAPTEDFVNSIEEIVMSHDDIIGIHDLVVHNYGPGRCMISLHAEVPCYKDIFVMHEIIDDIEKDIYDSLSSEAVIHMDPIDTNNPRLKELKNAVLNELKEIDEELSMHDFRMVPGKNHTNLIFDVVVPFDFKKSNEEIKNTLQDKIHQIDKKCFIVINFDTPYVKKSR